MFRLTPEMVKAAYIKVGRKPIRGMFLDTETGACCGMSAYVLAERTDLCETTRAIHPKARQDNVVAVTAYRVFDEAYADGFVDGFDDANRNRHRSDPCGIYTLGFEDGCASAKAVFHEILL